MTEDELRAAGQKEELKKILKSIRRKAWILKDDAKRPPPRPTMKQRAEEIITLSDMAMRQAGLEE
jgi:hypothetical protein